MANTATADRVRIPGEEELGELHQAMRAARWLDELRERGRGLTVIAVILIAGFLIVLVAALAFEPLQPVALVAGRFAWNSVGWWPF